MLGILENGKNTFQTIQIIELRDYFNIEIIAPRFPDEQTGLWNSFTALFSLVRKNASASITLSKQTHASQTRRDLKVFAKRRALTNALAARQ